MRKLLTTIGSLFGDLGRSRRAVSEYERLDDLSDASLARHGLKRGDIVNRAYEAAFGKSRD